METAYRDRRLALQADILKNCGGRYENSKTKSCFGSCAAAKSVVRSRIVPGAEDTAKPKGNGNGMGGSAANSS
jgi:hypothetical protein